MKKLIFILSLFLCCCSLFSEINFLDKEELERARIDIYQENANNFEFYMGAKCTTNEEVLNVIKMKNINLDDYFMRYLTIDIRFDDEFFYVFNIKYLETGSYWFLILKYYQNIQELYLIKK